MSEASKRPVLSVVDYDAWNRGYMPPSEHILIDQLAYRGARVKMSSDWGDDGAIWIVIRGKELTREMRLSMRQMLEIFMKDDPSAATVRDHDPA
jgi:hypothetical protein